MVLTPKNLDWWCERGILFLLLAMLVFAPLSFGAVEPWALLIVQGLALVVFVLWGVRLHVAANRRPKILWPPLAWVVLAFAGYAGLRWFTADIEYVARLEVLQVLMFAAVFFVVLNNLRGQEETEAVVWTLIVLATLMSGYATLQFLSHSDRVWNVFTDNKARASGTYISPNHFAGFLEMILPLALAFLLAGKLKIVPRILMGYAVVAMLAGLTATFSRAGWVAAVAGILFVLGVLLGHKNHRRWAAVLLAVLLVGGGIFVTQYLVKTQSFTQRVKTAADAPQGAYDWDTRLMMWGAAERMWRDNFWFGVGPAHYDYRFREYRPPDLQARPDRCHNDYLNLLADWGAVGGVIVLAGMGIFIFGLLKTWPHVRREENDFGSGQSNRFAFFLGATGGLVALAVHSVMDFNLHIPANALIAVTLLALLSSNLRFATETYWVRVFSRERWLLAMALGGVVFVLLVNEWRQGRETFWLARTERMGNFSPERAAALQQAFAAEPKNFQTAYDIGECFRTEGLEGGKNYQELTKRALAWYARASALNGHDGYGFLRTGMCLDWLGDHAAAEHFFQSASGLDPNSYYLTANLGWHYVQTGDYSAARQCFNRSLRLFGDNPTARNYEAICDQKLIERASGKTVLPAWF